VEKWIKRLLMVAGLVALPKFGFELYDRFTKPRGDLIADVRFGPFVMPPGYTLVGLHPERLLPDSLVREAMTKAAVLGMLPKDAGALAPYGVGRYLRDGLSQRMPKFLPYEGSGYWLVDVRNDGTQVLSSVVLALPSAEFICVTRDGTERCARPDSLRAIGDLQPRDVVHVMAWTTSAPSEYDVSKIRLTHSLGIGAVNAPLLVTSPFWYWMSRNWGWFMWFGGYWGALGLVWVAGRAYYRRRAASEEAEDQPATT
jgi:hypothetical protein